MGWVGLGLAAVEEGRVFAVRLATRFDLAKEGQPLDEAVWTRADVWKELRPLHEERDRLTAELRDQTSAARSLQELRPSSTKRCGKHNEHKL